MLREKPKTGDPNCPDLIRRAKKLARTMSSRGHAGTVGDADDNHVYDKENEDASKVGARAKRRKQGDDSDMVEATNKLTNGIDRMVGILSNENQEPGNINSIQQQLAETNERIARNDEKIEKNEDTLKEAVKGIQDIKSILAQLINNRPT